MGVKVNPKSEGRNPNNTAKRQGLAFQISAFGSLSDFGIREPIAKLPRSSLSKARSPSPLPSPSGRGRTKGRVAPILTTSRFRVHCRRCSLSLRERAGVRGNRACEYQRGATFAIASRNPKFPRILESFFSASSSERHVTLFTTAKTT